MSNYEDFVPSSTGGVSSIWTVKTSNYTAVAGDNILADSSSSAITITLPASPVVNTTVNVADFKGNSETNNITVARNGNNIISLAEDFTLNTDYVNVSFIYVDATIGWTIV